MQLFFAKSFSSNIDVAGGAIYHLDTMLTFVHNIRRLNEEKKQTFFVVVSTVSVVGGNKY